MARLRKYETYDTSEGFGNPDQWRSAFNSILGKSTSIDEAHTILGTSKNTPYSQLKARYYKLSKQFHPDKNPNTLSQFQKINNAYKTLTSHNSSNIIITQQPTTQTILPQLPNEISEHQLEFYLSSPLYCAQEKFDGRRRLLHYFSAKTLEMNKKGVIINENSQFNSDCYCLNTSKNYHELILDGEEIGDTLHIFDILSINNKNIRNKPYKDRISLCTFNTHHFKSVYTAFTTQEKRNLFNSIKSNCGEGIIFKLLSGTHIAGYSEEHVKFKFWASASVIVTGHNSKNSISISIYSPTNLIPVGNVTMTGHTKPPIGSIVEIKYLYIIPGGSLYQPSFISTRDDVSKEDCTINKLKFKHKEI
jgi:bifunctional non-homologous end joining protein LigD